MRLTNPQNPTSTVEVGYCTNVHPGESVPAISHTLRTDVAAVRRRVAPGRPFGLGLRLGNTAATTLAEDAAARAEFCELLEAEALYVFTVNGFPYGDFAADRVKAEVYRPDWRSPERRRYTRCVAEALVAMPGPTRRTVSTVAGGFKPDTVDSGAEAAIAAHLRASAEDLARLADRTGIAVRLCLEPEPLTTLETTEEVVSFFERHGLTARGGAALRDHLGLCYDCCHQAVEFESPTDALDRLDAAGIAIGKMQVSSALALRRPADPAARAALLAFAEPRFLHQVVARFSDGRLARCLDLESLAEAHKLEAADEWRCHFHVPIDWAGDAGRAGGHLHTTRDDWRAAVGHALARGLCDHFEVETYTWGVLPAAERAAHLDAAGGALPDALAAELGALLTVLSGSPP